MSSNRTDQNSGTSHNSTSWHIRGRGTASQISQGELVEYFRAGRLFRSTMVWREGMPNWAPLENVPELLAAIEFVEERSLFEQLLGDSASTEASDDPGRGQTAGRRDPQAVHSSRPRDTIPTDVTGGVAIAPPPLLDVGEDETTDIDASPRHTPCSAVSNEGLAESMATDEDAAPTVVFDPQCHVPGLLGAGGVEAELESASGDPSSPAPRATDAAGVGSSASDGAGRSARSFQAGAGDPAASPLPAKRRSLPPSREHLAEMRKARRSAYPELGDEDEKTVVYRPSSPESTPQRAPEEPPGADSILEADVDREPPTLRPPSPALQRPRSTLLTHPGLEQQSSAEGAPTEPSFDAAGGQGVVALPPHAPPRRTAEPNTPTPVSASVELHRSMQSENERSRPTHSRTSPALRVLPAYRRVFRSLGDLDGVGAPNGETLTGVRQALVDTQLRQRRSLVTVAFGAAAAAAVVTALFLTHSESVDVRPGDGGKSGRESAGLAESSLQSGPKVSAQTLGGPQGASDERSGLASKQLPSSSSMGTSAEPTSAPEYSAANKGTGAADRNAVVTGRDASRSAARLAANGTPDLPSAGTPSVAPVAEAEPSTLASRIGEGVEAPSRLEAGGQQPASDRRMQRGAAGRTPSVNSPSAPRQTVAQTKKQQGGSGPSWNVRDPGF